MKNHAVRFGGAALITGASSGIGEAFARALASRGMDVVLVARRAERLEALARTLESEHKVRTLCLPVDLTDSDAAQKVQAGVSAAGWSVGLLVNNAGFGLRGPFEIQRAELLADMVDVNCRAPVALTRAFLPDMLARGKGGVIFVASTAAYQPAPYLTAYAATKAFNLFMAEALWAELKERGVSVLGLSPGLTRTGFQEVSGSKNFQSPFGVASPEAVVETALEALGSTPSVIHGSRNAVMANIVRLLPRWWVVSSASRMLKTPSKERSVPVAPPVGESNRFGRTIARMLITFAGVNLIDLVVGSLLAGRLRFWFPAWLDAQWATRSDPWVTYSQSYLSGVFFIPLLASEVAREFVPQAGRSLRTAIWLVTLPVLGFIIWWKGGLMREYDKELEALAWLALTGMVWGLLRLGEGLRARLARVTPVALVRGLTVGVALFFLVMSVVDPLVQVAVQHLPWSQGLFVEMGFFVPAGLGLMWLTRRLRPGAGAV